MPEKKSYSLDITYGFVKQFFSSRRFFYFIVIFAIAQALWYTFSFKATLFDEPFHFEFIQAYSSRLSPFITEQPPSLDILGEVTRFPSYLFHYLMSWPFRLMGLFTNNLTLQLIGLRLINTAFFVGGLFLYRKLLLRAAASAAVTHISLLFIILVPVIAVMPGVINYDNAIFLLSGLLLLSVLKVIQEKNLNFFTLATLATVAMLGSLIKFSFLALVGPVIVYLAYVLWQRHRNNIFRAIGQAFAKTSMPLKVLAVSGLVLFGGLFIERHAVNLLVYQEVKPSCQRLLSANRCTENLVAERNIEALANKLANFQPEVATKYALLYWIPGMIYYSLVLNFPVNLPVIYWLFHVLALLGVFVLLLYIRDIARVKTFKALAVFAAGYTLILFLYNYYLYTKFALPVATNGRYLLPVLPIFFALVALSAQKLFIRHRGVLLGLLLALIILLSTQGGGFVTYLLTAPPEHYLQNDTVLEINNAMKEAVRPLVLESPWW